MRKIGDAAVDAATRQLRALVLQLLQEMYWMRVTQRLRSMTHPIPDRFLPAVNTKQQEWESVMRVKTVNHLTHAMTWPVVIRRDRVD